MGIILQGRVLSRKVKKFNNDPIHFLHVVDDLVQRGKYEGWLAAKTKRGGPKSRRTRRGRRWNVWSWCECKCEWQIVSSKWKNGPKFQSITTRMQFKMKSETQPEFGMPATYMQNIQCFPLLLLSIHPSFLSQVLAVWCVCVMVGIVVWNDIIIFCPCSIQNRRTQELQMSLWWDGERGNMGEWHYA